MPSPYTLTDLRDQMRQVRKLGWETLSNPDVDGEARMIEGIIDSMTSEEREFPELLNHSRRDRIAQGCGMDPSNVIDLLSQYQTMSRLMRQIRSMS